jgi:hypothetical protein
MVRDGGAEQKSRKDDRPRKKTKADRERKEEKRRSG